MELTLYCFIVVNFSHSQNYKHNSYIDKHIFSTKHRGAMKYSTNTQMVFLLMKKNKNQLEEKQQQNQTQTL